MKKFLSLALALAMLMSMCACGGKEPTVEDNQVENTDAVTSEVPENTPPAKVTGDRVAVDGKKPVKVLPKDWELGEVSPDTVICEGRFPEGDVPMKMTMSFGSEDTDKPVFLKLTVFTTTNTENTDMGAFELETEKGDTKMVSRSFQVDGVDYFYYSASAEGQSDEHLYKIVQEESTEHDNTEAEDGEENSGEDVGDSSTVEDGDSSDVEDGDSESSDMLGGMTDEVDVISKDIRTGDSSSFKYCEYTGLIGSNDTFKMIDKDDNEYIILLDHETGYIVGINFLTTDMIFSDPSSTDMFDSAAVRFEYNVENSLIMDVSNAEEDDGMSMLFILAQFMSLVDTEELTSVEG